MMLVLAAALVASLFIVLYRNQDLRSAASTAAERVVNSPLLPEAHWKTFSGSVWSMGYPEDWQVSTVPGGLAFTDPFTVTTYLTVGETSLSLKDITASYTSTSGVTKSEFLFAGYPATKFTLPSGQQDYYIAHNQEIFTISTQYPDDQNVGIMLVTFQFLN